MSIATDVSRIKGNITAALAAIADKGVTVPDGSTSDALAGMIASIEAGGIQLTYNRLYVAATGTFTPTERTGVSESSPLIIEHDSGIIPFLVHVTASRVSKVNDMYYMVSWLVPHWNASYYSTNHIYSVSARKASSNYNTSSEKGNIGVTWDAQKVTIYQKNLSLYVNTDITYTWYVYGIE